VISALGSIPTLHVLLSLDGLRLMHALQPLPSQSQPVRRSRATAKAHPRKRPAPYWEIALETSVKLSVNVALSTVAVVALVHLLQYLSAHTVKLQELKAAVQSTEDRVQTAQRTLSYYFDPSRTSVNMQEQSNRTDTQRRPVVFQESASTVTPPKKIGQ
jgi:hypothetical protein